MLLKKKILFSLLLLLLLLIFVELASFFLVHFRLIPVTNLPKFYQKNIAAEVIGNPFRTEENIFGAWKKANSYWVESKSCFDAHFYTNEEGSRIGKIEFETKKLQNLKLNQKKYILLGDSFAEGYGVNYEKSVNGYLENLTGAKIYNYGSAGGLGILSYYLVYKNLAKKKEHDGVIILFFPRSDFIDHDYTYWLNSKSTFIGSQGNRERYRPYFIKKNGTYDYFIPRNAEKNLIHKYNSGNIVKKTIRHYFFSYNLLASIKKIIYDNQTINEDEGVKLKNSSGYYETDIELQKAFIFYLKQIVLEAKNKEILFVSIPILDQYRNDKNIEKKNYPFWILELKEMEKKNMQFKFIDLFQEKTNLNDKKNYLPCDGHWNEQGHRNVADVLYKKYFKK